MRKLAPLLWYGLITASSSKSVNGEMVDKEIHTRMPGAKGELWSKVWKKTWWIPVKGWHATEFGILYALLRYAGASKANAMLIVAAAASLDEYHQTFVEGRTGTPRDVAIDLGGALAAMGVESVIASTSRRA